MADSENDRQGGKGLFFLVVIVYLEQAVACFSRMNSRVSSHGKALCFPDGYKSGFARPVRPPGGGGPGVNYRGELPGCEVPALPRPRGEVPG